MQAPFQTLQEDAIPFKDALGLSIVASVLAVTRLCGCIEKGGKWYSFEKGNSSNLHIWTCLLSVAGSGGLLAFSASKIYEKYQSVYLGLILVNFALLGLYEIEYIRKFSVISQKLEKSCIWAFVCIGLLMTAGFIICFIYAIPSWVWKSILFSGGISYILVIFGYYCLWQSAKVPAAQRALITLCIPIFFIFIPAVFIRANRLVLPAWISYTVSSVCTLRFRLIQTFTRRGIFTFKENNWDIEKNDVFASVSNRTLQKVRDIEKPPANAFCRTNPLELSMNNDHLPPPTRNTVARVAKKPRTRHPSSQRTACGKKVVGFPSLEEDCKS